MTRAGFVIALRGQVELWRGGGARCLRRAWILVSRSGPGGALLLIGWAGRAEMPRLPPGLTLAARLQPGSGNGLGPTGFALLEAAPPVVIAGRFLPARGAATLTGTTERLFLQLAATLGHGLVLRIEAERRPWFGEVL